jgi:ankyrin repeat protein
MSLDAPYLRQLVLEAACEGDLDGIIQVLDDGSSIPDLINSVDAESGFTALHYACQKGYVEIVCFLLRHGAAINVVCQVC